MLLIIIFCCFVKNIDFYGNNNKTFTQYYQKITPFANMINRINKKNTIFAAFFKPILLFNLKTTLPIMESEEVLKSLGLRIRSLRKERGLTQIELAYRCNMEPSNLNRIEAGRTNPTVRSLTLVANGLGLKLVNLFEGL